MAILVAPAAGAEKANETELVTGLTGGVEIELSTELKLLLMLEAALLAALIALLAALVAEMEAEMVLLTDMVVLAPVAEAAPEVAFKPAQEDAIEMC